MTIERHDEEIESNGYGRHRTIGDYAVGVGICPTMWVVGVSGDRSHALIHFGPFVIYLAWGL